MSKIRYFTYTIVLVLLAAFCLGCAAPEEEAPAETEPVEEEMPADAEPVEDEMVEDEMPAETEPVEEEMPEDTEMPADPVLTGEELYKYVTVENDYKNWPLLPGKAALSNGTSPHGALVTIYVSNEALAAIEAKSGVMPAGSTVVKENYNREARLLAVTLMHKVEGFDPENNDWYWLKFGPNGTVDSEGKVNSCIDCHAIRADNDFIFTGGLT